MLRLPARIRKWKVISGGRSTLTHSECEAHSPKGAYHADAPFSRVHITLRVGMLHITVSRLQDLQEHITHWIGRAMSAMYVRLILGLSCRIAWGGEKGVNEHWRPRGTAYACTCTSYSLAVQRSSLRDP